MSTDVTTTGSTAMPKQPDMVNAVYRYIGAQAFVPSSLWIGPTTMYTVQDWNS